MKKRQLFSFLLILGLGYGEFVDCMFARLSARMNPRLAGRVSPSSALSGRSQLWRQSFQNQSAISTSNNHSSASNPFRDGQKRFYSNTTKEQRILSPEETFAHEFDKRIRAHTIEKWTDPHGITFKNKWVFDDRDLRDMMKLVDNNKVYINGLVFDSNSYLFKKKYTAQTARMTYGESTILDRVLSLFFNGDAPSISLSDNLYKIIGDASSLIGEASKNLMGYFATKGRIMLGMQENQVEERVSEKKQTQDQQKEKSTKFSDEYFRTFDTTSDLVNLLKLAEYLIAQNATINPKNKQLYKYVYSEVLMFSYLKLCRENNTEYELSNMDGIFERLDPILEKLMPDFIDTIQHAQEQRAKARKNSKVLADSTDEPIWKELSKYGLTEKSTNAEIKSAYHKFAKEYRPDLPTEDKEKAEYIQKVNAAWDAYNKQLQREQTVKE